MRIYNVSQKSESIDNYLFKYRQMLRLTVLDFTTLVYKLNTRMLNIC